MFDKNKVDEPQDIDVNLIEKSSFPAGLTQEQLMKMFLDQMRETAASNKALAEALQASRKPYVDPTVVEARAQAARERKAMVDVELRNRVNAKKNCPHKNPGSNSWNIKWMQHSNGIILGVCGICKSEFDARKPEERAKLLEDQNALRKMGRAGDHSNTRNTAIGQI